MSRTAAIPYVGTDAVLQITAVFGTSPPTITLKNTKWSLSVTNKVAEAPNTTDGMVRAPGLWDYSGTVDGFTDITSTSTPIEVSITPGLTYAFKLYRSLGAATFFSGNFIVGNDLKIDTGCDGGAESYSFSFMKAFGPLVSPEGVNIA